MNLILILNRSDQSRSNYSNKELLNNWREKINETKLGIISDLLLMKLNN